MSRDCFSIQRNFITEY